MVKMQTLGMLKMIRSETLHRGRAYLEGISRIRTGLRTATMSGVKLVRTSASPSGSRFTAPYKQLNAALLHQPRSRANKGDSAESHKIGGDACCCHTANSRVDNIHLEYGCSAHESQIVRAVRRGEQH